MIRKFGFAGVAALAILAMSGAAPAAAATPTEGLWYYDLAHIADAQAAGITGDGVTIAVLDSPINTQVPTLANANIEVQEPSYCYDKSGKRAPATSTDLDGEFSAFHGTNVVSYIAGTGEGYPGQTGIKGVAPGAKVLYYAVSLLDEVVDGGESAACHDKDGNTNYDIVLNDAMNDAMDAGADIISISAGYPNSTYVTDAFPRAVREGVVVVGSVANTDATVLGMNFPAGANGAVGVQAADRDGVIKTTDGRANADEQTMVIAPGIGVLSQGTRSSDGVGTPSWEQQTLANGTSIAAPIAAGFVALGMQKWPDATGNQMLQSLIRTTGGDTHEPIYDSTELIGYGFASATGLIANDPSQYPDENPLLGNNEFPLLSEIFTDSTADPTATAAPDDVADGRPDVGIILIVVVGVLLVAGGVVLAIVFSVRRARRSPPKIQ